MSDDIQREREEAQKRWRKWNEDRLLNKKEEENQEELNNYADKIMQKLIIQNISGPAPIDGGLSKEIESNLCPICMDIMVPPCRPMTLFPCGHTICKVCLLKNGREDRDVYQLAIDRCPICRQPIKNYTVNINLMGLISKYIETKEKQDKQKERRLGANSEKTPAENDVEALRIRCKIISAEESRLKEELDKHTHDVEILEEVLKKVMQEKEKIRQQREELEQKEKIVDRYAEQQEHKLRIARKNAENVHNKYCITAETLRQLSHEKEKAEYMLSADLVSRAAKDR